MEENKEINTLETEVKGFANSLPYWAKYICSKILSNGKVSNSDIDTAYNYVANDLKLIDEVGKPEIELNYNPNSSGDFKEELTIDTLKNVQGVNALAENQTIEFSPNVTVIYGANGSGKSGYIRLLKKAFYSKHKEEILKNIYKGENKELNAEFNFKSNETDIPLTYPADAKNGVFNQFAVFDGKIALKHLEDRNNFEFRPAGLTLFSEFNSALEKLQSNINDEITKKPVANPYTEIFEGESEINTLINSLSAKSNIEDFKKHIPFTEEDKANKQKAEKDYDDLKLALSTKDKQIKDLQKIKTQIEKVEENLKTINKYYKQEYLNSISTSIQNCLTKEETAKKEGVENFKTEKIVNVGSKEWKEFIQSAEKFAIKQKENSSYPEIGDNCILCQQPISQEQKDLIISYWSFLKSVAEKEAKEAQTVIDNIKSGFQKIPFTQFPEENTLTVWLKENYEDKLAQFKQTLEKQKELSEQIVLDIETKKVSSYTAIQINTTSITEIITAIDEKIKQFSEDEQSKALTELLKKKTYLAHKEKLEQQFSKIEELYQNLVWVNKANKFDKRHWKKQSTDTEKSLSQKYFNEQYIKTFNQECNYLNASFGIDIDARSSDGKSNRQLFLKGKTPSDILSEGEQKVIAIADFMTETNLSPINKGIVFDDPVNSLDHKRKEDIAKRLVDEADNRQVVIFTHDVVFLKYVEQNCLKKYGKDEEKVQFHTVLSNGLNSIGNVEINHSPIRDSIYGNSSIPNKYLLRAKKETDKDFSLNLIRSGFGALRTCYEAITVTKILGSTVQRFDTLIRVSNIKRIKYDLNLYERISERHSFLHDLIEGHLPAEELNISFTSDKLETEIKEFDNILEEIKKI